MELEEYLSKVKSLSPSIQDPALLLVATVLGTIAVLFFERVTSLSGANWNQSLSIGVVLFFTTVVLLQAIKRYHAHELEKINIDIARALNPPLEIVNKFSYARVIKNWGESGTGRILLYNIELQSFRDEDLFAYTWGQLEELPNIKSVEILLTKEKVRCFNRLIQKLSSFFEKCESFQSKFSVVEYSRDRDNLETECIAFACYQLGESLENPEDVHDEVLLFVLSEPFSSIKQYGTHADPVWNYHKILRLRADDETTNQLLRMWKNHYSSEKRRDVGRVLADVSALKPVQVKDHLEKLQGATMVSYYEKLMKPRCPMGEGSPARIDCHPDGAEVDFYLEFDNGETVEGLCKVPSSESPSPGVIWVGGFTEAKDTRLPMILARSFNSERCCQFFYEQSGDQKDITISRYQEDLESVVNYAARQPAVDRGKIIIVARSVNALATVLACSDNRIREKVSGIVLTAPVFDLPETLDSYRLQSIGDSSLRGKKVPTMEDFWRHRPEYNASDWLNSENRWLEYFGVNISLGLLLDVVTHEHGYFSLDEFVQRVSRICDDLPVCILTNPSDEVTGSAEAVAKLKTLVKHDKTLSGRLSILQIKSSHNVFEGRFAIQDETKKVNDAVRQFLKSVEYPTMNVNPKLQR